MLATLLVGAGVGLYHLTRGTTFDADEWGWILTRRGDGVGTFLNSHNGHFSLVPVAIYKLLFATAGLGDYRPYRALVTAAHVLCVTLVFIYARRRTGNYLALCAAALILFLGAGWEDVLWPFQMAWLISIAAGISALLMLDRRDRLGDWMACTFLAVSLASSGIGVVVAIGVVVDVLSARRRWRDAWIFAAPLVLYGAWWVSYQTPTHLSAIHLVPPFVANTAAASVASLVGASSPAPIGRSGSAALLTVGRPLGLIVLGLVVWRLAYMRRIPPRVLALLAVLASFWLLTALTRAWLLNGSQAWASRYLYVSGVFLVILATELGSQISTNHLAKLLIGAGVLAASVLNMSAYRNGAMYLRAIGQVTRADLGALQIGRQVIRPGYVAAHFPGAPFFYLPASSYFAAAKAIGTPAATPAEIANEPDAVRRIADEELISIHQVAPRPARGGVSDRSGTLQLRYGGKSSVAPCRVVGGSGSGRASGGEGFQLTFPSSDLVLTAHGGPAELSVRRFADEFEPVGTLPPSVPERVRIVPDLATHPWHLRVRPSSRVTICGVR